MKKTSSSPVEARITGPSNDMREEGRGGGAAANGMGLAHGCWTEGKAL